MIPLLILPKPQSKVGKTIAIRINLKILMVPAPSIIKDGEICCYSTGMAYLTHTELRFGNKTLQQKD